MAPEIETSKPRRDVLQSARERARTKQLEVSLRRARDERASQTNLVEEELGRLTGIYGRMRSELEETRQERDRALDDARTERERRARETLELAEKLEEAVRVERNRAEAAVADSRERFVQERLAKMPTEHRKLEPGQLPKVPGFRVIEQLGKGGMATVFRAERLEDAQEVALKLLHEGSEASRTRVELFLREAAVMLQLDHPNLLKAFDAGDCAYGRFLVLQVVRGQSLAARVRREGPLSEAETVQIALDIGRALRYCARLGLTHRDVKPSNILQDEAGEVRICDFGLTALVQGDSGRPYGSPGYAAPEQLTTPDQVDERADIYALGCAMWHLAVGRRPFTGPPKKAFEQARKQDLSDPRFEGADISPRLAQVIRRMGRAARSRRYRNWDECLLDLMLVEKGNPPFAAHLADALAADDPAPIESPSAVDAGHPRTAEGPSVGTAAPPPAHTSAAPARTGSALDELLDLGALRGLGQRARVAVLVVACMVSALVGAQMGSASTEGPVEGLERHALAMADDGRFDEAAVALRAAAELLPQPDADRLRALALRFESR